MRRADRLFQIIQALRGGLATAKGLAARLEVSERTVYRDIQDLVTSGVPIEGEAGVGYILPESYDLPPLMFTADEIEALVLGARVVEEWTDRDLASAARTAIEKVEAVLPDALRDHPSQSRLFSVSFGSRHRVDGKLGALRHAISQRRKVRFRYQRADGCETERTAIPICLVLSMSTWLLVGWCELRNDFRTFRLDRMDTLQLLDEAFEELPERGLESFLHVVAAQRRETQ